MLYRIDYALFNKKDSILNHIYIELKYKPNDKEAAAIIEKYVKFKKSGFKLSSLYVSEIVIINK
jgi:hypothetical protein